MKAKNFGDPYYLDVTGFRDIQRYYNAEIDQNPEDLYFYGTEGLYLSNQPSILGSMGEIEKDAEYKPGIRCKSLADALTLQATLQSIDIGDICFDTTEGTGIGKKGERLFTFDPIAQTCRRRRYADLGLGDVKQWKEDFDWGFEETPPEINIEKLQRYQMAYPLDEVSAFFAHHNDVPEDDQNMPWFRLGTAMYWEVENRRRTGAVYIDAWLGYWTILQEPDEEYSDYKGIYKQPLQFGYEKHTPYVPPYVERKSIFLFVGMQPADRSRTIGGDVAYELEVRNKTYSIGPLEFEVIFYRYMSGPALWDNADLIFDYISDFK